MGRRLERTTYVDTDSTFAGDAGAVPLRVNIANPAFPAGENTDDRPGVPGLDTGDVGITDLLLWAALQRCSRGSRKLSNLGKSTASSTKSSTVISGMLIPACEHRV